LEEESRRFFFEEGETIDVGVKIAEIEDDASVSLDGGSADSSSSSSTSAPEPVASETVEASPAQTETVSGERRFYTPLVKKLADENGVTLEELSKIQGTGAAGRVNKSDFMNYLSSKNSSSPAASVSTSSAPAAQKTVAAPVAVSAGDQVIEMDNMRKAIAKNMVASKQISPHVNSIEEVDLTHLVKFREGTKAKFLQEEGFKLTYTPLIMHAIIQALKEFPMVNSSIDGDKIIVKKQINLGMAVAVPGNGLIVPVVKNADALSLRGLCRAVNDLAIRAREKKLTMDDLTGGTFTFSNVGSFGTLMATPIILQPQVGIYASGAITKRVAVLPGDVMAIRSMMFGTHAYDHRIIDGELGGKFLASIHRNLRDMDPEKLL
jgi:2-oxoglutarate dehydrogenase E2 component (dihydrolipoamide succinyltransferase)